MKVSHATSSIRALLALTSAVAVFGVSTVAQALPTLQLYVDGTYDMATESWVINSTDGEATFWVIADTTSSSLKEQLSSVNLVVGYDSSNSETASVGIRAGDTLLTGSPPVSDGSVPEAFNGKGGHGEYGAGTTYTQFGLGSFTDTDDPIADFTAGYQGDVTNGTVLDPANPQGMGDARAYTLVLNNISGNVSLDVWGMSGTKVEVAPFSHDVTVTDNAVPEMSASASPSAIALLLGGALLLASRKRQPFGA